MEGREEQEERAPEVPKVQPLRKPLSLTAVSVFGLFILAIFYTVYLARDFFLPVTLAWVISLLLKPGVRWMEHYLRLPLPLGAGLLLLTLVTLVLTGLLLLSAPASDWMRRAPESLDKIEVKVRGMMDKAQQINKAAETVEHLAAGQDETPEVELKRPGLLNSFWNTTKGTILLLIEVFVLLYFFLAAGDVFVLKLIQILPRLREKKQALEIVRGTEKAISKYLVSLSLLNAFEGTVIGLGLAILGVPNPALWGVLAFFANYIPYIGALVAGSIVTIVALISFDSIGRALIAPLIYFGTNFLDNFLAPYVMGKRLTLNPVVVFLAVMFWGWLWGIVGVLLAVPLTMTIKLICDHSVTLAPFAEFLTAPRKLKPEMGAALQAQSATENA